MASSGITFPERQNRVTPELPKGIQRWTTEIATVTGQAAATTTQLFIQFNIDSLNDFQYYVSLDSLSVQTGVATLDVLAAHLQLEGGDWEDYPQGSIALEVFPMRVSFSATITGGQIEHGPYYLGRTLRGVPGSISVILSEVENTTYNLIASGLISDRPFLASEIYKA